MARRFFSKPSRFSSRSTIAVVLLLLNRDGFEKKRLAIHVNVHPHDIPMARRYFSLLDQERAAFVEMTEQPAAKLHFTGTQPMHLRKPLALGIQQKRSLQMVQNHRRPRRGVKIGIGPKAHLEQIALAAIVRKPQRLRKNLHEIPGLLLIVALFFLLHAQTLGMIDQFFYSLLLGRFLIRAELPSI